MASRLMNDTEIAKAKRDFELKKAAYDVEVQTKVRIKILRRLDMHYNCLESRGGVGVRVAGRQDQAADQGGEHADQGD